MNYFPKTEYWRPLVPDSESADETNYTYLKILAPHMLHKMKQSLFWFLKINMLQYPCVQSNLQNYEEVCEWNVQMY